VINPPYVRLDSPHFGFMFAEWVGQTGSMSLGGKCVPATPWRSSSRTGGPW
jgi:hypothetical protein